MNVGFIGLGVMGRPMAGHLIDAGHSLALHRVKDASRELVERGGKAVDSATAAAKASDVIILMLPDTPDVEHVLFGKDGVVEGLSEGKLVIDMSSISPVASPSSSIESSGWRSTQPSSPIAHPVRPRRSWSARSSAPVRLETNTIS